MIKVCYVQETLHLQGSQQEVQLFDFACSCRSATSFVANKGLFGLIESAGRPLGDIASSSPATPGKSACDDVRARANKTRYRPEKSACIIEAAVQRSGLQHARTTQGQVDS